MKVGRAMTEGTLYLVATPIGNLDDMTYRAVKTLEEVEVIACEDTRHTRKLLNHFDIHTHTTSYHEHNKEAKGPRLIEILKEGKDMALVTDAGTPGISDPGEDLVKLCYEHGITVTALPGAVAAINALILSGQSTRYFAFEGFLPSDKKQRRERLQLLSNETRTIIFYEAPHRLIKTLELLLDALGNRKISTIKEITKRHETVYRASLEDAIDYYKSLEQVKGEFVVVVEGKDLKEIKAEEQESWEVYGIEEHLNIYLQKGMSRKDAMKAVAKDRGVSKRVIYSELEKLKEDN